MQKIDFTTCNPILLHFFYKTKGGTLRFFSDFDKKSKSEKSLRTTLCFVKKMKRNKISSSKIDYLNKAYKSCSRVNSKILRFPKKHKNVNSENGSV